MEEVTKKYEPNAAFLQMVADAKEICWIAIDNRERAILAHNENFAHLPYRPMQMTVGDYAICRGKKVLAIIERKSLEDYAASLKDGRHANKGKMTKLREETGCRVIYIVEGPLDPAPGAMIGKTPYKYIENSIYHLMIRDNIQVIRTKNTLDTSKKLARFVESMMTLEWEPANELDLTTGIEITGTHEGSNPNELLTADRSKSDSDILRECWACFRGITVESAEHYIRRWSISDVILRKVPIIGANSLAEIKINNRHISKPTQAQLADVPDTIKCKILSLIPGISSATASEILAQMPLDVLLATGLDEIKALKITKQKKSLGEAKAKRILKILTDSQKL